MAELLILLGDTLKNLMKLAFVFSLAVGFICALPVAPSSLAIVTNSNAYATTPPPKDFEELVAKTDVEIEVLLNRILGYHEGIDTVEKILERLKADPELSDEDKKSAIEVNEEELEKAKSELADLEKEVARKEAVRNAAERAARRRR